MKIRTVFVKGRRDQAALAAAQRGRLGFWRHLHRNFNRSLLGRMLNVSMALPTIGDGDVVPTAWFNEAKTRLDIQSTPDVTILLDGGVLKAIKKDGTTIASGQTARATLLAVVADSASHHILIATNLELDNTTGSVNLGAFQGILEAEKGVQLKFQTASHVGLRVTGGTGAVLRNLYLTYVTIPTVRVSGGHPLQVDLTTDTLLYNIQAVGGGDFGVFLDTCVRPAVIMVRCSDQLGDGLHLTDCRDWLVDNLITNNTGDDGFASHLRAATAAGPARGVATNIVVKDSNARGIAIGGAPQVVVQGFSIENTKQQGLIVMFDTSFGLAEADHVHISNGVIKNGGEKESNYFDGLTVLGGNRVHIENVSVIASGKRGVALTKAADGVTRLKVATLRNVYVNGCKDNLSGEPGRGILLNGVDLAHITDCLIEECGGAGLHVEQSKYVVFDGIVVKNAAKTSDANRAYSLYNNQAGGHFVGRHLTTIDDQAVSTGYKLFVQDSGTGLLTGINALIVNGAFALDASGNTRVILDPTTTAVTAAREWAALDSNKYLVLPGGATRRIRMEGTDRHLEITGGTNDVTGGLIQLMGSTHATEPGIITLNTLNAALNAAVRRMKFTHGADVAAIELANMWLEFVTEISDPAAPAANRARLYMRDNGAGKTQLVARFPTGAIQVIATEP